MKYLLTLLFFFCALFASAADNYLVATVNGNDVTYPIDSPEDFEITNHSTSTTVGDYSFTSNNETVTVTRSAVKSVTLEIPLTRAIKENETYFCAYLFYNCTNLTEANITFGNSDECTSVGDSFCAGMFYNCSALVSLPDEFNLPQKITSVWYYFCFYMFNGCSSLDSLPDAFNIPQGIKSVNPFFCVQMFFNCSSLTSLPDAFNIPQGITDPVRDCFCYRMFYGCSSLVSLPDNFNLPQNITDASYASDFCNSMFYNCSKLAEGTTAELTFPLDATNAFYGTSFAQTTYTTNAIANETYILKGNSEFYKIRYYNQDGNLIKTQHIEKPEEGNSVTIGEFAVDGTTLVEDPENYAFRYWVDADGARVYETDEISEDINLYAYITEIEKADGNSEYVYDLTDENFDYDDHDCVSITEDGDITITVGKDAYIIIGTSENANLTLKDAEGNTLELETDNESNLVYHYEGEDQADFTITAEDGSVSKITIQNVADYYRHITYYDQYNEIIGTQKIEVDTQITDFAVTADDLELSELQVFGGWMYSDGTVATVEDVITEDVALYPIIVTYKYITYYDQYNEIIGTQKIEVDTQITDFAVTADDLELSESQVFGGWMYSDGTVATVEDVITEDVALYPIITTIVIEEPTSISSVTTSAELVGVEYYDLAGRKVAEPQRGVNIVVEYYSDGEQKTIKLLQK